MGFYGLCCVIFGIISILRGLGASFNYIIFGIALIIFGIILIYADRRKHGPYFKKNSEKSSIQK